MPESPAVQDPRANGTLGAAISNAVVGLLHDLGRCGCRRGQSNDRLRSWSATLGYGMRPRADSPGLGLGLSIIATLTKTLSVEDARPGVRLRMTFTID